MATPLKLPLPRGAATSSARNDAHDAEAPAHSRLFDEDECSSDDEELAEVMGVPGLISPTPSFDSLWKQSAEEATARGRCSARADYTVERPRLASPLPEPDEAERTAAAPLPPLVRAPPKLTRGHTTGMASATLTTFDVYMTTCETMWGVIIFLKFGVVVMRGGLLVSLCVMLASALVQVLNCLAVSAVATNGHHNGAYNLLVGNLGPVWGASASLLYYLGMTAMATVEICGAVEALNVLLEEAIGADYATFAAFVGHPGVLGSVSLLLLSLLRAANSHIVHGIGIVVLVSLFVTLSCALAGAGLTASASNLSENLLPPGGLGSLSYADLSMMLTFMYPCFAGIFQPVNKAAQLKTPFTSVPRAAIGAVVTSATVFASILVAVACKQPLALMDELDFILDAWPSKYVGLVGTVVVGVGSCVSCLDVAPTILQTIAADGIVPGLQWLGIDRLSGHHSEPQRATAFTCALALPFAWLGSLELVALAASALFLQMYFTMDVCCLLLSALRSPGWRPQWPQIRPWQAAVAAVLCAVVSLLLNPMLMPWTFMGTIAIATVISLLSGGAELGSGDAIVGLQYSIALQALHMMNEDTRMAEAKGAERFPLRWRPQLLVIVPSYDPEHPDTAEVTEKDAEALIKVAHSLKEGRGLTIVATIVELKPNTNQKMSSSTDNLAAYVAREYGLEQKRDDVANRRRNVYNAAKRRLEHLVAAEDLICFTDATVTTHYHTAVGAMMNFVGVGALRPNAVLVDWPLHRSPSSASASAADARRAERSMHAVERALSFEKAVLLLVHRHDAGGGLFADDGDDGSGHTIDVWWVAHDGALPLMLAHLLTMSERLGGAHVRIFMWVGHDEAYAEAETETRLRYFLSHLRIRAHAVKLITNSTAPAGATLEARSLDKERQLNAAIASHLVPTTKLVITNLTAPTPYHLDNAATYTELLETACEGLPPVLFVCGGAAELNYVA